MKTKVFGLTGSIGSGKSEAARILSDLGAHVIDADILAREAVEAGKPALREIVSEFGQGILNSSGKLDRKRLGDLVFTDAIKRARLEEIIHPRVRELFHEKYSEAVNQEPAPACLIYVVPLLFESSNKYPELSKIIVVSAPLTTRIQRIMQRDSCTEEFARSKISAQMEQSEKVKLADIVIENDGSLEDLRHKVTSVYQTILN